MRVDTITDKLDQLRKSHGETEQLQNEIAEYVTQYLEERGLQFSRACKFTDISYSHPKTDRAISGQLFQSDVESTEFVIFFRSFKFQELSINDCGLVMGLEYLPTLEKALDLLVLLFGV